MFEEFWLHHEIRCAEQKCETKLSRVGTFLLYFVPAWILCFLIPFTMYIITRDMVPDNKLIVDLTTHERFVFDLFLYSALVLFLLPCTYALVALALSAHSSPEQRRARREKERARREKELDELKQRLHEVQTKNTTTNHRTVETQVDAILRGRDV